MAKNLVTLLVLLFLAPGFAFAQKGKAKNDNSDNPPRVGIDSAAQWAIQMSVYEQALGYNDFAAATQAIYNMLALQPERSDLKDTLCRVYYTRGMYVQAVLLGRDLLTADPDKMDIREIVAISEESLGLLKESLANYEHLYQKTGNPHYLYQVAGLQYKLKRYGECSISIESMLASEAINDQKITISYPQGGSQRVAMRAAVLNMKGTIARELSQDDLARASFEEALKLEPDFILAKANLQVMDQAKENDK